MIRVEEQPEPSQFDALVRKPGQAFLADGRHPTGKEWDHHRYWTRMRPDMRQAYHGVCAYSAHWIPPVTGGDTIDHFVPKSVAPQLAYEWSNYRLASTIYNSRKRDRTDIVDSFKISGDWFWLTFPAMLVKPNPQIDDQIKVAVSHTINVLGLNDETIVDYRLECILEYCDNDISINQLDKTAPFITYELRRQGLVDAICDMMSRRQPSR